MVVVANVDSPEGFKILYVGSNRISEDSWSPDNEHVVFAMRPPNHSGQQLVKISRENSDIPETLKGPPAHWDVRDCNWTRDGQHLVFAALVPPVPVDWPTNAP
ncbi:MAG: hypothetical protein U0936_26540 [Planctomycetaceae bacterium]